MTQPVRGREREEKNDNVSDGDYGDYGSLQSSRKNQLRYKAIIIRITYGDGLNFDL
jgi:hypothetical protein